MMRLRGNGKLIQDGHLVLTMYFKITAIIILFCFYFNTAAVRLEDQIFTVCRREEKTAISIG